ncbi:helix-turn-helix transcriptional regulator [bacterium]|nr:helix-turn-helix transcriptional regulator [bacterium]
MFENIDRKFIGNEIKKARKNKRLSQFELAEITGIDEKQIYRIESGLSSPKLENFLKIADVLDLDIKYFNPAGFDNIPYAKEILEILFKMSHEKIKICYGVLKSLSDNL